MAPVEADRPGVSPGSARKADAAVENGMLSPGFRKAAAMAGWDEEALLAGLVVEDTPDRDPKRRKRFSRTPPTSSKRRRRSQRRSPRSVPVIVLSLDEDQESTKGESSVAEEKNAGGSESADATAQELPKTEEAAAERVDDGQNVPATATALPCMDKLREELSCAICLDICFEPSTTACGHSFCLKCLKCATSKCGKRCPKCRDLIGNARSCTVNTVLWNTIQLLFPEEVESRRKKKPASPKQPTPSSEKEKPLAARRMPNRSAFILSSELVSESELTRSRRAASAGNSRRRVSVSQSEDAALALRLQREEFIGSVAVRREQVDVLPQRSPTSVQYARANLRALASRAIQLRTRVRF